METARRSFVKELSKNNCMYGDCGSNASEILQRGFATTFFSAPSFPVPSGEGAGIDEGGESSTNSF
jgi:hypothetical protein